MSEADVIIGVDVGGTHVRMGMVDESLRLLAAETVPSSSINGAHGGPERLLTLLHGQTAKWCGDTHRPAAVALGFPSTISRDKRVVLQTPNLRGFDRLEIVDLVEKRFGVPAILEKDVIFLLAHDISDLRLATSGTIVGVYFGTGIGNAIFMNGRFYTGKNGVAGELSHIPVMGATRLCGCGNTGCAETEASGKRLAEIVKASFPGEQVGEVFERHGEDRTVQSFFEWLSMPVATEINILDPDEVVIGGGIIRMKSFPREDLKRRILEHARKPLPHDGLSIHFSRGDAYAGILGGAYLALNALHPDRS